MSRKIKIFIQLRGRKILDKINTFVSDLIPVIDLRKNPDLPKDYIKTTLLQPAYIAEPALHYNYDPEWKPYWINMFNHGFQMNEIYFIHFRKVYLLGLGVIIDEKKKLVLESAFFQKEYIYKLRRGNFLLKNYLFPPSLEISNVIPLINRLSNNYFHWTIEHLTRIILLMDYNKKLSDKYSVLIWNRSPNFVVDALKHLVGWPERKIIRWSDTGTAKINSCILISYPVERNNATLRVYAYSPHIIRRTNQLAFQKISLPVQKLCNSFVVSRRNVNARNLVDEIQLVDAFPDLNLEIVYLEKMNFVQQVQLFQSAKIIIAPHGAGLTNLIYCNNKVFVIELYPIGRNFSETSSYYQISKALDINFNVVMVPPINAQEDMKVDDTLINKIKTIFLKNNILKEQTHAEEPK